MPDFRETREAREAEIKEGAEKRGASPEQATEWAKQRMANAMPRVVRQSEEEGTSRVIEINSD